jgi:hypothetical protein
VWAVLASTHIGKGVTTICKTGTPTGKILLIATKMTGRMDLQLNAPKTPQNNGEWGGKLYPSHSHNVTFSSIDICFNIGTDKSTHTSEQASQTCDWQSCVLSSDSQSSVLSCDSPVYYLMIESPVSHSVTDGPVSYLLTGSHVLSCDSPVSYVVNWQPCVCPILWLTVQCPILWLAAPCPILWQPIVTLYDWWSSVLSWDLQSSILSCD